MTTSLQYTNTSNEAPSALQRLATTAHQWQHKTINEEVDHAVRKVLIDWFATTLPGCVQPPATLLSKAFSRHPCQGGAASYVEGSFRSPRHAAMINATASHTVEFDDIFKDGGYHPGSPTIAAALAVAQDIQAERVQLHRAIIAGYEVGCRIALAIQPSHYRYWHTTSTVGTIGAAVATTMLLGGDHIKIGHAMALASSFAGGHKENLQNGGMAKALHAGHAAEAGVLAGYAAMKGATGSLTSLDGETGLAAATSDSTGRWERALSGLGEWTPITRMTVKMHGCCGHIFAAIDALDAIAKAHSEVMPDRIRHIHVEGYSATAVMCDRPDPATAQEARFSLQYCMATWLMTGRLRLEAFDAVTLLRDDIRTLMSRITVTENSELAARYPQQRSAIVHVELDDGSQHVFFQETRKGDPENPVTLEALIEKYDELAGTVLDPCSLTSLKTCLLDSEQLPPLLYLAPQNSSDTRVAY